MRRFTRAVIAASIVMLLIAVFLTAGSRSRRAGKVGRSPAAQSPSVGNSLTYSDADQPPPGAPASPGMRVEMAARQARRASGPEAAGKSGSWAAEEESAGPGAAHAAAAPPGVARKVIMTAQVTLEVKEFPKIHNDIIAVARQLGGYVEGSDLSLPTEGVHGGSVTIRVPQEQYEAALSRVRDLGRVVTESQNAQDVTQRYVDLDARVRNLKAEEERILDILRRTRTIKETLQVEERLSAVRERIEVLEGQFRYLKFQIGMATIKVTLTEKATVLHYTEPRWEWMGEVKGAWHSLVALLQSLATVLTYVGVFGVIWLPILGLALWGARRYAGRGDVPPDSQ